MLSYIKHRHSNVKCMADQIHSYPHFEKIFKEHPCINLVHVILFCKHGNQFITKYKCNNHACNRHNDRIGQILYQAENTSVPALWCLSNLSRNLSGFLINICKHCCQIGFHHSRQKSPHPLLDCFKNAIEHGWFSFPLCLKQSSQKRDKLCSD